MRVVIGTAGRLSPVKGHAGLLRARSARSSNASPTRGCSSSAAGRSHAELLDAAARLGIAGACVFAGARHDVHDLMAAMDVFVLPSLDEGIPMALLEAMALGMPVVATAVGGVPEVVQDCDTGMLVAPGDERALAAACLRLITDHEWASAVGARGQAARRRALLA